MHANRPSRVLCATNFSDAAHAAMLHACAVARDVDAAVVLVHVLAWDHLSRQVVKERMARLEAAADAAAATGVCVSTALEVGPTAATILEAATARAVDLIVLGAGARGWRRLLAPASRLVQAVQAAAPCPTLVVPRAAVRPRRPTAREHVLCAIDFSPSSLRALEYARALTSGGDRRLTVVHVLEEFAPEQTPRYAAHFEVPEYRRARAREAWQRLRGAVGHAAGVDLRVVAGRPWEAIARAAGQSHADLVVVGTSGAGRLRRWLGATTLSRLVRDLAQPLLAVPAHAGAPLRRSTPAAPPASAVA